jgi:hypothetical protein
MKALPLLRLVVCSTVAASALMSGGIAASAQLARTVGEPGTACPVGLVEAPPFADAFCAVTLVEVPPYAEPWIA